MAYIGAEPDGMGKAQRFTFTASGSGTDVTADDDGIPIGYTAGQVSVYLNGVKQVIGSGKDVTATDGSTITFASAYAADDVIEVVALSIFSATTVEGTALISTGETGTKKFLRVDGDGTSSWAVPEGADINSTGETGTSKFLRIDGDGTSSWQTITIPAETSHIQQTSVNLIGTITDRYFLSLAYVLTGNVTFSGNVILGKMIDGTTDVSITNDGSDRTISGSGTVTFNNVLFN